jgi:hypothetical protein
MTGLPIACAAISRCAGAIWCTPGLLSEQRREVLRGVWLGTIPGHSTHS